jgi:hypothetical protein
VQLLKNFTAIYGTRRDRGTKATPEGGSEATGTKASKRAKQPAEYKKNHLKILKSFKH